MFFEVTNPFNPYMSHTHGRPGIFTIATVRIARLPEFANLVSHHHLLFEGKTFG